MRQARNVLMIVLVAAGLSLLGTGCKSSGTTSAGEVSGSKQAKEHPQKADHPDSEHPKDAEHPKSKSTGG